MNEEPTVPSEQQPTVPEQPAQPYVPPVYQQPAPVWQPAAPQQPAGPTPAFAFLKRVKPWMWAVGGSLLVVMFCCCGGTLILAANSPNTSTPNTGNVVTHATATSAPVATDTPAATATPIETATPAPTATLVPTVAPTPAPTRQQLAQKYVDRALKTSPSWPFSLDIKSYTVKANSDKSIVVAIVVGEGLDFDQITRDIHAITYDVMRSLWQSGVMSIDEVDVNIKGPVVDQYGKTSTGNYSGAMLLYDTAKKFVWENLLPDDAWNDYDLHIQFVTH